MGTGNIRSCFVSWAEEVIDSRLESFGLVDAVVPVENDKGETILGVGSHDCRLGWKLLVLFALQVF